MLSSLMWIAKLCEICCETGSVFIWVEILGRAVALPYNACQVKDKNESRRTRRKRFINIRFANHNILSSLMWIAKLCEICCKTGSVLIRVEILGRAVALPYNAT